MVFSPTKSFNWHGNCKRLFVFLSIITASKERHLSFDSVSLPQAPVEPFGFVGGVPADAEVQQTGETVAVEFERQYFQVYLFTGRYLEGFAEKRIVQLVAYALVMFRGGFQVKLYLVQPPELFCGRFSKLFLDLICFSADPEHGAQPGTASRMVRQDSILL